MPKIDSVSNNFIDVINNAFVILSGTVKQIINSKLKFMPDKIYVESIFKIEVSKVIKGDEKRKTIQLRILGGTVGDIKRPLMLKIKENQQFLFMLAPDIQPKKKTKDYVLYNNHGYHIKDNQVILNKKIFNDLKENKLKVHQNSVDKQELISVIKKIDQFQTKKRNEKQKQLILPITTEKITRKKNKK